MVHTVSATCEAPVTLDCEQASGACFSKDPEIFRAHKAIFSSSVSRNGEVFMPRTSCMKETSVHIKNNHKV